MSDPLGLAPTPPRAHSVTLQLGSLLKKLIRLPTLGRTLTSAPISAVTPPRLQLPAIVPPRQGLVSVQNPLKLTVPRHLLPTYPNPIALNIVGDPSTRRQLNVLISLLREKTLSPLAGYYLSSVIQPIIVLEIHFRLTRLLQEERLYSPSNPPRPLLATSG